MYTCISVPVTDHVLLSPYEGSMLCLYQRAGPTVPVSPPPANCIPGARAGMADWGMETVKTSLNLKW